MASPEQDSTLQALVAGELPDELVFDPITDNDSTGSCLGCAYSVLSGAAALVTLYAAVTYEWWDQVDAILAKTGGWGWTAVFSLVGLIVFTVIEMCSTKEIFVLDSHSGVLQLRHRKGDDRSAVVKSWPPEEMQRYFLDPPTDDPLAKSCLYVKLAGEEPLKLLEACYQRDFVEQIATRLEDICQRSKVS